MDFDPKNEMRATLLQEITESYKAEKAGLEKNVNETQSLAKSMTESFYKATNEIDEKRTEFIRFFIENADVLPKDFRDYVFEWKKEHSQKLKSAESFAKLLENSVRTHKLAIAERQKSYDKHCASLKNIPNLAYEKHKA